MKVEDQDGSRLVPNLDHLIFLMNSAIEDHAWREQAAQAGPQHVHANYTWDHAIGKLVQSLLSSN